MRHLVLFACLLAVSQAMIDSCCQKQTLAGETYLYKTSDGMAVRMFGCSDHCVYRKVSTKEDVCFKQGDDGPVSGDLKCEEEEKPAGKIKATEVNPKTKQPMPMLNTLNKSKEKRSVIRHAGMRIFVKTMSGKVISLDVNPDDSIKELKSMIYDKEGIKPNQQRLIFKGRQLKDSRSVADYNIANMATLHLTHPLLRRGFWAFE